jgi:hypothetical protein
MLEGTIGLFALSKFQQSSADRHPLWDELMQEAAIVAFHAQALEPI